MSFKSKPLITCSVADWSNETYRRIALATLVEIVKNLEYNRQGKILTGENPESFGFELHGSPLVDKYDRSYYGAIFRNKNPKPSESGVNPPKFVIVFRGTMLRFQTFYEDLRLDAAILCHSLHKSSRVKDALVKVLDIIDLAGGPENVWLDGHSLGAAISLAVGRTLVLEHRVRLETFLFNPPIVSSPTEFSQHIGRFFKRFVIGMLEPEKGEDPLKRLSHWVPHLYINVSDPICQGYLTHFKHMHMMEERATKHSVIDLIAKPLGKDFQSTYLIPSADLTITGPSSPLHELRKWRDPGLQCNQKLYRFGDIIQRDEDKIAFYYMARNGIHKDGHSS